ncbi:hypothetical protein BC831DRAFT_466821 [Entophlyctis helioformis]|nr:hypothetical protein BC831DRAFT_466821 [Entophlyctis helioformis]
MAGMAGMAGQPPLAPQQQQQQQHQQQQQAEQSQLNVDYYRGTTNAFGQPQQQPLQQQQQPLSDGYGYGYGPYGQQQQHSNSNSNSTHPPSPSSFNRSGHPAMAMQGAAAGGRAAYQQPLLLDALASHKRPSSMGGAGAASSGGNGGNGNGGDGRRQSGGMGRSTSRSRSRSPPPSASAGLYGASASPSSSSSAAVFGSARAGGPMNGGASGANVSASAMDEDAPPSMSLFSMVPAGKLTVHIENGNLAGNGHASGHGGPRSLLGSTLAATSSAAAPAPASASASAGRSGSPMMFAAASTPLAYAPAGGRLSLLSGAVHSSIGPQATATQYGSLTGDQTPRHLPSPVNMSMSSSTYMESPGPASPMPAAHIKATPTVTVIGFPPSAAETVRATFAGIGPVANIRMGPRATSNWMVVTYTNAADARRALEYDGQIVDEAWLLAVKSGDAFVSLKTGSVGGTGGVGGTSGGSGGPSAIKRLSLGGPVGRSTADQDESVQQQQRFAFGNDFDAPPGVSAFRSTATVLEQEQSAESARRRSGLGLEGVVYERNKDSVAAGTGTAAGANGPRGALGRPGSADTVGLVASAGGSAGDQLNTQSRGPSTRDAVQESGSSSRDEVDDGMTATVRPGIWMRVMDALTGW